MFIKKRGKGIEKLAANLELVLQQLQCEKTDTAGTDENLFRLVPMLGHGARVLPLQNAMFTGTGARVRSLNGA